MMNSFYRYLTVFSLGLCCLLAMMGCTHKDNLTGTNWSDIQAQTVRDTTGLSLPFSFPADTLVSITGGETMLLAGNYRNAHAVSYFRFTGLPSLTGITFESEDSCYVSFKVMKRSPQPRSPILLKLYKTNQAWNDTLSTISEAEFTEIPNAQVEINEVPLTGTTVKFKIPNSTLFSWQCPDDSTGFNLAVKTPDDGYVEIASAETSNDPILYLKYKHTGETSYSTYQNAPAKDSFYLDAGLATGFTPWGIDNLYPRRMYIDFDPTVTLFKDDAGHILDSLALKRTTINRATLLLHVKENPYYTGTTSFNLFPLLVKRTGITAPVNLLTSDLGRMTQSLESSSIVTGDSLEVDITPLVQAYTSGDKEALGIVILSQHERRNFGYMEFYDTDSSTPAALKPVVKITYTPPFLQ